MTKRGHNSVQCDLNFGDYAERGDGVLSDLAEDFLASLNLPC